MDARFKMSEHVSDSTEVLKRHVRYFSMQVLASYRSEPDKYELKTDYFEGRLTTTTTYWETLEGEGRSEESIDVRFGFRSLADGELAVAAWLPDLSKISQHHMQRWLGFHLDNPSWIDGPDERFGLWVNRYIIGSWEVDNGPLAQIRQLVITINCLTKETLGHPLFQHEVPVTLHYPAAQNDHQYQDAHRELYGYLVDGLDKKAIQAIAQHQGKQVNIASEKTIKALKEALPGQAAVPSLWKSFEVISEERRKASHGIRKPAVAMPAFEKFTDDLWLTEGGLRELLIELEQMTGIAADSALKRGSAMDWLPKIDRTRPPHPNSLITRAPKFVGKTVERVDYGFREEYENAHDSELLIIYFTDGSILGIDTATNALNLETSFNGFKAKDLHVDLRLAWVPPLESK